MKLQSSKRACLSFEVVPRPLNDFTLGRNGLNDLNLSPFYDVIDTFSHRRYSFRKRLRVITFGTAQAMERLELVLRLQNDLNGAQRLNGLNVLNDQIYFERLNR